MKKIKLLAVLMVLLFSLPAYGATVSKGAIGAQDIHQADGTTTRTFTRPSSTGGTITLNDALYEVDALIAYGGGVNYTQATIEAALTAIGTTNKVTLLLRPGNWVILTALAFPANVTVNMPAGAYFSGAAVTAGTITIASNQEVTPEMFGLNTVPGTTDMTTALQAAVNARLTNNTVRLTATSYKTTSVITFPVTSHYITIVSDCGSVINAAHTGDGINLTVTNENYGRHSLIGIDIVGPNSYYGDSYTSTGAGVRMHRGVSPGTETATAYKNVIRDVEITGFKYGILMQSAYLTNVEGRTYIWGNEYGLYVEGGPTNTNTFVGTAFRQNKIAGIYSAVSDVAGTYATMNRCISCLVESNVPYNGGAWGTGGTTDSMGIVLKNAYDWEFSDLYVENQDYAIYISDSSSRNRFNNVRLAPGTSGLSKVVIAGPTCYSNSFSITQLPANATDVHVEVAAAAGDFNRFVDCVGVNFIAASILTQIEVINNRPYADGTIKNFSGALVMPSYGATAILGEGTTAGRIDGIGTATATLYVGGYGEISLEGAITDDTTITAFSTTVKGQLLVIRNYQVAKTVTIATGAGTDTIVLKGGNIKLNQYGQQVVFYINSLGRAYEVGRNFTSGGTIDAVHGTTTTTIADTRVITGSRVMITPTNAIGAGIAAFVSSVTNNTGFVVTHTDPGGANHGSFNYIIE